jgi:hypothetical protein
MLTAPPEQLYSHTSVIQPSQILNHVFATQLWVPMHLQQRHSCAAPLNLWRHLFVCTMAPCSWPFDCLHCPPLTSATTRPCWQVPRAVHACMHAQVHAVHDTIMHPVCRNLVLFVRVCFLMTGWAMLHGCC